VKELAIEGGEPTAQPDAERDSGGAAGEHRRDRQFREVRRDREPAVAERSQHADLRALQRDQTQQHVVDQERRDRQKDRRHHRPGDAVLVQLVADELVRQLMLARVGAEPPVGREQDIDRIDHRVDTRARREPDREVVEGALHVEARLERLAPHPEDPEVPVVGKRAAEHLGDELG
jgi:hypothetical protein